MDHPSLDRPIDSLKFNRELPWKLDTVHPICPTESTRGFKHELSSFSHREARNITGNCFGALTSVSDLLERVDSVALLRWSRRTGYLTMDVYAEKVPRRTAGLIGKVNQGCRCTEIHKAVQGSQYKLIGIDDSSGVIYFQEHVRRVAAHISSGGANSEF